MSPGNWVPQHERASHRKLEALKSDSAKQDASPRPKAYSISALQVERIVACTVQRGLASFITAICSPAPSSARIGRQAVSPERDSDSKGMTSLLASGKSIVAWPPYVFSTTPWLGKEFKILPPIWLKTRRKLAQRMSDRSIQTRLHGARLSERTLTAAIVSGGYRSTLTASVKWQCAKEKSQNTDKSRLCLPSAMMRRRI